MSFGPKKAPTGMTGKGPRPLVVKPPKPLKRTPLKTRTRLRKKGKSTRTKTMDSIQAVLRELVMRRDGGCVLREVHGAGKCGGYTKDGELILQAEHLNGRAHAISYAELENIVCLCQYHHIFFKKQNPALYWVLIRKVLGEARWERVQAWILDKTPTHRVTSEWKRIEEELKALTKNV